MRIISQNATNFGIEIPSDTILRINLAWCNSISELKNILDKYKKSEIFLDLPIKRIKPPNNRYSIDDLIPILENYSQIRYFAISNVETKEDIKYYLGKIPPQIIIVPKIESPNAVKNIAEIVSALPNEKKIIMLDHDDLFSTLIKNNEPKDDFKKYITNLVEFCASNNVILLRTIGVIFGDGEQRATDYVR